MTRLTWLLIIALPLLAAEDPWAKVQALPNRSELKIYQKGARDPLAAVLADANAERLVVVVPAKKQQLTIQKDEIDRLDARPLSGPPSKPAVTKTEKTTEPDYTPQPGPNRGPALPGVESSSSVSFGGNKPDFKTVYVRPAGAPRK